MPPFRVRALTIACTDSDASHRFYVDVLGATRLPTEIASCPWVRLGALDLALLPNASMPSPATFPTHAMPMLWLEVDDLAAAERRFEQASTRIVEPSNGTFMLIADPDGLVIEVWQAERALDATAT